nr:MAG TPA: Repressor protein CI [Caudoviricetes sp.]
MIIIFSQKLKLLRKKAGITQEQLAKAIGVERSSVGKYEGKGNIMPSHEVLAAISNYFDVSIDYLLNNDNSKSKKGVWIPVLGTVQAGVPMEAIEDIIDYEEIDENMAKSGEYFALQIKGASMEPRFVEGDVVIVRKQPVVENGDIAVVMVNGDEATVKKFYRESNGIKLIPINPSYDIMFYTPDEVNTLPVTILGKVVELRGKF